MPNTLIIVFAVLLLMLLLYFEKREKWEGMVLAKTPLSALFIVALLVQPNPVQPYSRLLLGGLILCLAGDVFLALPQKKMFMLGLVAFLIGHVFYVCGFFWVARSGHWTWIGAILTLFASGGVYNWLRPHLESMKVPVLFYVIVITVMVIGAWSVLGDDSLALPGKIMVFIGAVSFYFSDIFVARDRFMKKEYLNRLIGLPMYYAAQYLLAFSTAFLK